MASGCVPFRVTRARRRRQPRISRYICGVTLDVLREAEVFGHALAGGGAELGGEGGVGEDLVGARARAARPATGTRYPVSYGTTSSRLPGMSLATTGTPAAIASMTALG